MSRSSPDAQGHPPQTPKEPASKMLLAALVVIAVIIVAILVLL
jgi:hypothetical protein